MAEGAKRRGGFGEHFWGALLERSWGALLGSTDGEYSWREVLASVGPTSQPGMDSITYPIGFCSSLQLLDKELK